MDSPHTHQTHNEQHDHHQPWKSHAHEEDQNFRLTAKVPRLASPRDAVRPSSGMASPVRLGLGLGLSSGQSAFTFMQLQELEHQALIFKYMVAGVPVPLHLVLPIWKSVVSSPIGMFQPSSMPSVGLCFDFRNNMEPEPGRCRRTDGKKWRCSKEVVPDHKYCEKHMHRGRNRSRKPVERQTVLEASKSSTTTTVVSAGATTLAASAIPDSSTQLSISICDGLSLVSNSNQGGANPSASVSSSPRLQFSPTSVLHKVYYGASISESSSSGSTSKTESNFGELV